MIKLKEIVQSLVGKAEAAGDPLFLRMRNSELSQQLTEKKTTREREKRELETANKRIKGMLTRGYPMECRQGREVRTNVRKETVEETRGVEEVAMEEVEMVNASVADEEIVQRPPLRGVSKPVPTPGRLMRSLEDEDSREREFTGQISAN